MSKQQFQILVLPGGGFLGLHTAVVIAEIEDYLGHSINHHFDLIAGTSIGGIIALGLARGTPASEIVSMFEQKGPEIFSTLSKNSWKHRIPKFGKYFQFYDQFVSSAAYDSKVLKDAVIDVLGKDTILGQAERYVIIPTLNLSKGGPTVFKTPHTKSLHSDWKVKMADIAIAGSAAPLLFPLAEIDDRLYADGAFFANSPELTALHEASHFLDIKDEDIKLLTIGTTTSKVSLGHSGGTNWGIKDWVSDFRILEFMMASQVGVIREMTQHRLQDRYHIIDSDRGKYATNEIGLHIATPDAIKTLRALGKDAAKAALGTTNITDLFNHNAPPPQLFHGPNANKENE